MKDAILPLALFGLASVSLAQSTQNPVTAETQVLTGCTVAAPTGSLVPAKANPPMFLPNAEDVVVVEIESIPAPGSWVYETTRPYYQGSGYFRWNGPNLFNISGQDPLTYHFRIDSPGTYNVRVWTQQNAPDASDENDVWVRVDDGGWKKLIGFQVGFWNQNAVLQNTHEVITEDFDAGYHTIEFSGRSTNFKLDRFEVVPQELQWGDVNRPAAELGASRPLLGQPFSFQIDDPTNSRGLTPGAIAFLGMGHKLRNAPCGVVLPQYGELLVSVPFVLGPLAEAWQGPGTPAVFTLAIPNDPTLLGRTFTWQGALAQPGQVVLTDALDVTIGNQ